jgi:adenylate cyclase
MTIWSAEIKELKGLYESLKGQYPDLEKELERLVITEDENIVLIYARRCLEVIVTDLCVNELKRPRKTEPLKGIIEKLNKEQKVPSHIITSMINLNSVSTFAAHPKEFNPRQVRTALIDLGTVIEWYLKYRNIKPVSTEIESGLNHEDIRMAENISLSPLTVQFEKSIVVLPFQDMSPEKDQDYFCDGITEEIINALTHIESLKVIARTTSFAYKNKYEDVRSIGKELNVETILEGSLRKSGDKLRITSQLIRVSDGAHLWSERYDREMKDIFEIQDEISLAIVEKLKIQLFEEERKKVFKSKTQNLEAYKTYLKGLYHWNKRTKEGLLKSIEYFEKAIEIDTNYALAYTGLADTYIILAHWGYTLPKETKPKAKEILLKSLEIDDKLADTYTSLAFIYGLYEWEWQDADINYKRALELNPNLPKTHLWYAVQLVSLEKLKNALAHAERALELDPLSLVSNNFNAITLYALRQYDEAINQFRKTLLIDDSVPVAYTFLSFAYLHRGLYAEAVKEYQNLLSKDSLSEHYVPVIRDIYSKSGIGGFLHWLIDEGLDHHKQIYWQPYYRAICHAWLGEKDKAFEWLEKVLEIRSDTIFLLLTDQGLDNLRSDPRFPDLLKRVGLK